MSRNFCLSGIGLGVYLVGLGITYVLYQTNGLDIINFWFRLYPVLIILLGLDFILAHLGSTASIFRQPGGFIVTFIFIITISGLLFSAVPRFISEELGNWPRFNYPHHFSYRWQRGPQFTVRENFKAPAGVSTVEIHNKFGNIDIDSTQGSSITANASIRVPIFPNRFKYQYSRDDFKITGAVQGNRFIIELIKPEIPDFPANFAIKADIRLQIPKGFSVTIQNSAGNVSVGRINGNLNTEMAAGNFRAESVDGNLLLNNKAGNINIDTISGNADITTKAGQVRIKKVRGESRIESDYGEVVLEECSGPVNAELKAGNLAVRLAKINGSYEFINKMGNIKLSLPADAKFSLDARCEMGNIDSDFPAAKKKELTSSSIKEDVNGGGPLIRIETKTGNIKIHKF